MCVTVDNVCTIDNFTIDNVCTIDHFTMDNVFLFLCSGITFT